MVLLQKKKRLENILPSLLSRLYANAKQRLSFKFFGKLAPT